MRSNLEEVIEILISSAFCEEGNLVLTLDMGEEFSDTRLKIIKLALKELGFHIINIGEIDSDTSENCTELELYTDIDSEVYFNDEKLDISKIFDFIYMESKQSNKFYKVEADNDNSILFETNEPIDEKSLVDEMRDKFGQKSLNVEIRTKSDIKDLYFYRVYNSRFIKK